MSFKIVCLALWCGWVFKHKGGPALKAWCDWRTRNATLQVLDQSVGFSYSSSWCHHLTSQQLINNLKEELHISSWFFSTLLWCTMLFLNEAQKSNILSEYYAFQHKQCGIWISYLAKTLIILYFNLAQGFTVPNVSLLLQHVVTIKPWKIFWL